MNSFFGKRGGDQTIKIHEVSRGGELHLGVQN